jgi:integrase
MRFIESRLASASEGFRTADGVPLVGDTVATDDERWAIEQDRRALELLEVVVSDPIRQPLAPWSVSADFRRHVRELELPRTRFHDLRHAHATQLLVSGVHPKAVSERLMHSSVAFTMDTYSAVIPSLGRAAADAADSCSGKGEEGDD